MKKAIFILLTVLAVLSLTSCSPGRDSHSEENEQRPVVKAGAIYGESEPKPSYDEVVEHLDSYKGANFYFTGEVYFASIRKNDSEFSVEMRWGESVDPDRKVKIMIPDEVFRSDIETGSVINAYCVCKDIYVKSEKLQFVMKDYEVR